MSDLSAGLAVALLAERVGTPEDFVLHLFLGGRYAAVSRVFARLLIFAEALFQFCYPPIPPTDDDVQFVNSLVKTTDFLAQRIIDFALLLQFFGQAFHHLRYIRNHLFHRYKATKTFDINKGNAYQFHAFFVGIQLFNRVFGGSWVSVGRGLAFAE